MERQDTITLTDEEDSNPWGKIVSLSSKVPNKSLSSNEYTFGRATTNSVVVPDKRLSGTHCKITKESDGKAYLTDLSTNGTFFGDEKLGKNVKKELVSGDKFYLLHPSKVSQDDVVGYVFAIGDGEVSNNLKRDREEVSKPVDNNSNGKNEELSKQMKLADDLGEEMQCSICIDYIYQCVTLMPCLHNFCAACFSDWMKKSNLCPQCREEIHEIKRNAMINNIIGKFLEAHPTKKRPKEEYESMDKLNTITQDRIVLKTATAAAAPATKGRKKKEEELKDDGNICVECRTARPSDGFKCNQATKSHLTCTTCSTLFPDRRDTYPQECVICSSHFCNLYFKCNPRKGHKLLELQNHEVAPNLQDNVFRGNKEEVKILRDYMNLFQEFLKDVVDKNNFKYKVNKSILPSPPPVSFEVAIERKSPVCTKCFEPVWWQILFRYREYIKAQLPSTIRDRHKCWYGLNCKTMLHNDDHAKKLDHVCEQTKF